MAVVIWENAAVGLSRKHSHDICSNTLQKDALHSVAQINFPFSGYSLSNKMKFRT